MVRVHRQACLKSGRIIVSGDTIRIKGKGTVVIGDPLTRHSVLELTIGDFPHGVAIFVAGGEACSLADTSSNFLYMIGARQGGGGITFGNGEILSVLAEGGKMAWERNYEYSKYSAVGKKMPSSKFRFSAGSKLRLEYKPNMTLTWSLNGNQMPPVSAIPKSSTPLYWCVAATGDLQVSDVRVDGVSMCIGSKDEAKPKAKAPAKVSASSKVKAKAKVSKRSKATTKAKTKAKATAKGKMSAVKRSA